MKEVKTLQIVVASLRDVQTELNALGIIVADLNHTVARDRELRLELLRCETESYLGFHSEVSARIDGPTVIIQDCDLLVSMKILSTSVIAVVPPHRCLMSVR